MTPLKTSWDKFRDKHDWVDFILGDRGGVRPGVLVAFWPLPIAIFFLIIAWVLFPEAKP